MKLRRQDKTGKILNVSTQLNGEIILDDEQELIKWICEGAGIESTNDNGKTWEAWMKENPKTKIEKT